MLKNQPQFINFLSKSTLIHPNHNINHLEFIRKKKSAPASQKTFFSNDFLKQNITKHHGFDEVIQLKLQNEYSPRKGSVPVKSSSKKLQKTNPYKEAIQKMRTYEQKMLSSLQKSFNVTKKTISQHKDYATIKQSHILLSRSKTALSLQDLKNQFNKHMSNYEHIVMPNPEVSQNRRMIQSAIIEKPKRVKVKNLSVLSNYSIPKSSSEPKFPAEAFS